VRLALRLAALAATAAAVAACYPDDISSTEELDTVTTLYDKQHDFGAGVTYALPDTVVFIDEDGTAGDDESDVSHQYDDQIIASIRENLNAAGYTELTGAAARNADLAVLASSTTATTVGVYYDWWYYWGYYPYWPGYAPGWGYGYPPVSVAYAYSTGTLIMTMIDLKNADVANKSIPVLWIGAVNGVLTGNSSVARVTNGIDQAFVQSPYLDKQ